MFIASTKQRVQLRLTGTLLDLQVFCHNAKSKVLDKFDRKLRRSKVTTSQVSIKFYSNTLYSCRDISKDKSGGPTDWRTDRPTLPYIDDITIVPTECEIPGAEKVNLTLSACVHYLCSLAFAWWADSWVGGCVQIICTDVVQRVTQAAAHWAAVVPTMAGEEQRRGTNRGWWRLCSFLMWSLLVLSVDVADVVEEV